MGSSPLTQAQGQQAQSDWLRQQITNSQPALGQWLQRQQLELGPDWWAGLSATAKEDIRKLVKEEEAKKSAVGAVLWGEEK